MNEQYDKFEKRLADQLANHSVDAPADMWDRIAASMAEIDAAAKPATPPITIAPHRRQRLGVRRAWQYGIAAMLLLGIGLLANRLVGLAPQPDQSELLADATVLYDPASIATEKPAEEPINAEPTNKFARVQTTNARKSESSLISEHSTTEPSTEQETRSKVPIITCRSRVLRATIIISSRPKATTALRLHVSNMRSVCKRFCPSKTTVAEDA